MKNKLLPLIYVLTAICLVLTVVSNQRTKAVYQSLNEERYKRIVVEENLQQAFLKVKSLESQLSQSQEKLQNVDLILNQGKSENTDLKIQLQQLTKLKESLERSIADIRDDPSVQDALTPVTQP